MPEGPVSCALQCSKISHCFRKICEYPLRETSHFLIRRNHIRNHYRSHACCLRSSYAIERILYGKGFLRLKAKFTAGKEIYLRIGLTYLYSISPYYSVKVMGKSCYADLSFYCLFSGRGGNAYLN